MAAYQDVLRHLAVNDRRMLGRLSAPDPATSDVVSLDPKTQALVRVASLVATDGTAETFRWTVDDALAAGASRDEVVAVLLAIAPLVGFARVSATAPRVALALDYDIDAALERLEP